MMISLFLTTHVKIRITWDWPTNDDFDNCLFLVEVFASKWNILAYKLNGYFDDFKDIIMYQNKNTWLQYNQNFYYYIEDILTHIFIYYLLLLIY